jgi:DNA-binding NarL/FixJ family response regulator
MPQHLTPPSAGATQILLVEDYPDLRRGFRLLIEANPDWRVCGEAETAPHALELARTLRPELAIIDITLRSGNGLELIEEIRTSVPDIRILVLSMHSEEMYAKHAMRLGAMGYLMKQDAAELLPKAIECILRNEVWLSETLRKNLNRDEQQYFPA